MRNIWVGKVHFNVATLGLAYCISAVQVPIFTWKPPTDNLSSISTQEIHRRSKFYSTLPILSELPAWRVKAALVQGQLWVPKLAVDPLDVCPRESGTESLEVIAHIWMLMNAMHGDPLEHDILWEVMYMSAVSFKIDQFIEDSIGTELMDHLECIRAFVDQKLGASGHSPRKRGFSEMNGDSNDYSVSEFTVDIKKPELNHVFTILNQFFSYISNHEAVASSPKSVQLDMRRSVKSFIHAALTQEEQSLKLRSHYSKFSDPPFIYDDQDISYHQWVQTIASENTSGPLYFHLYCCLIANPGEALFKSSREIYLAKELSHHTAVMYRQYNDAASIARDIADGSLSSINFAEFHGEGPVATQKSKEEALDSSKHDLLGLAEYERSCCLSIFDRLDKETGIDKRTMTKLRMYFDANILLAEIYLAKDFNTRVR